MKHLQTCNIMLRGVKKKRYPISANIYVLFKESNTNTKKKSAKYKYCVLLFMPVWILSILFGQWTNSSSIVKVDQSCMRQAIQTNDQLNHAAHLQFPPKCEQLRALPVLSHCFQDKSRCVPSYVASHHVRSLD